MDCAYAGNQYRLDIGLMGMTDNMSILCKLVALLFEPSDVWLATPRACRFPTGLTFLVVA